MTKPIVDYIPVDKEELFLDQVKKYTADMFKPGDRVAVKLHFGERGNKTQLGSAFVKKVVAALNETKIKPFLYDSPVMYPGQRNNSLHFRWRGPDCARAGYAGR